MERCVLHFLPRYFQCKITSIYKAAYGESYLTPLRSKVNKNILDILGPHVMQGHLQMNWRP